MVELSVDAQHVYNITSFSLLRASYLRIGH